ncbi:MAG: DUF4160 domain-containing protein [Bacteroidota bacterium]
MPEISRFYGIIIKMYFVDHNPPHFHAFYQGEQAEYEITTLDVLAGKLPSRAHAMVLEWASSDKKELLANWQRSSLPVPLESINPLK